MTTPHKQTRFKKVFIFLFLLSLVSVLSCKEDDHGTPSTNTTNTTVKTQGGSVVSADKNLQVDVPQNTFSTDASIKVTVNSANDLDNGVGSIYSIETDGGAFTKPVTLTFKYTDEALTRLNTTPEFLTVNYRQNGGAWQTLPNAIINSTSKTMAVATTHFSDWTMAKSLDGFIDVSIQADSTSFSFNQYASADQTRITKDSIELYYGDKSSDYRARIFFDDFAVKSEYKLGQLWFQKKGESFYWYALNPSTNMTVKFISVDKSLGGKIIGTISGKMVKTGSDGTVMQGATVTGTFCFLVQQRNLF